MNIKWGKLAKPGEWTVGDVLGWVVIFALGSVLLYPKVFPPKPQERPKQFKIGDKVDVSKLGVSNEPTIVLVTASGCKWCTASMTFYKHLYETAKTERIPIVNVATANDTAEKNVAYFGDHGITLSSTPVLAKGTPFMTVPTPSLFVIAHGKVLMYQEGKIPTEQQEKEFIDAVVRLRKG